MQLDTEIYALQCKRQLMNNSLYQFENQNALLKSNNVLLQEEKKQLQEEKRALEDAYKKDKEKW